MPNIDLKLSATQLEVAAGESVEVTITIRNKSEILDHFGIKIQGLSSTWWTLSAPKVSLWAGAEGEVKLTIHPPRGPEAKAGSYTFQVRAVSEAKPDEMTEQEAYLVLRGFAVWDVEMSPTKAVGRSGNYRLIVSNSSNTDITLTFEGKDEEEALDYEFSHGGVTVPAGKSAWVTLKVCPKREEKGKTYNFQVLVRPTGASGEAKTINGQLEYRRRPFPWKWILLALALVAVALIVWKFVIPPHLPVINEFYPDPPRITPGDISTLHWSISDATNASIDWYIGELPDLREGERQLKPPKTREYTLRASNRAGNDTKRAQITVLPVINYLIAAGRAHTVALMRDDTVKAEGDKTRGQCNVNDWTDIIQVAAGGDHTVGLKSDGTVFAKGSPDDNQCEVGTWTDIIQVAAGGDHTVGLKSDGTMFTQGSDEYGQRSVMNWPPMIWVAAGDRHTVGLKSDGTVEAVGWDYAYTAHGEDVTSWTDIIQVAAGGSHTVGLKFDKTVVALGDNSWGQCEVGNWTDIIQVAAGGNHTVGLKSDGTVVATGQNSHGIEQRWVCFDLEPFGERCQWVVHKLTDGRCDLDGWANITQIAAGESHTVGLVSDGTVVAAGWDYSGQCDFADW